MKRLLYLFIFNIPAILSQAQPPTLQWAVRMGAGGVSIGYSIATDTAGNVYTTGSFSGTVDFDPGVGTYTLSSTGSSDIFISKLNASGAFVWAQRFGGTGIGGGYSIVLDAMGNVFTTGFFTGTADFDPGPGTSNLTAIGNEDIYVSKLNTNGVFVWAKRMGGGSSEYGEAVAVDASGNVYTTGFFQGPGDYDPGVGNYILSPTGADIFISKLDASGNFVWAERFGGSGTGSGRSIITDPAGNVYIGGFFSGTTDFDPGPGTFPITTVGSTDIFVSKLNSSGAFVWAKGIGGTNYDGCYSISLDIPGNVYVTGSFQLTADFDPGAGTYTLTSAGLNDAFITKLDAGGSFVWAEQMGSTNDDFGQAIKVDAMGNVYTTGYFNGSVDFDPGPGVFTLNSAGADDIFISKLNTSGNFIWALEYGGTDSDISKSMTVDTAANVYTTGYFSSTADFDPGPGVYTLTAAGNTDIFIQKLCVVPSSPTNVTPIINQSICTGLSTTLSASSSGTINWFASPTSTIVLGTGTNYITPTLTVGNYTYYAEASTCFANPARTAISITVNPLPVFSAGSDKPGGMCSGETATLSVIGVTSATWVPGGPGTSIAVSPTITTTYTVYGANGGCAIAAVIVQPIYICTGIQQLTGTNWDLDIYPNPVTNELNIKNNFNSEVELHLYDNNGKLILNKFYARDETVLKINTSIYPEGIYFLRLNSAGKYYHSKVVITQN